MNHCFSPCMDAKKRKKKNEASRSRDSVEQLQLAASTCHIRPDKVLRTRQQTTSTTPPLEVQLVIPSHSATPQYVSII